MKNVLPIEEIKTLYQEGKSLKIIARTLGTSHETVRRRLRAEGIVMRAAGPPLSDVGHLAKREGISRQAAWYRLRRATGKPVGVRLARKTA